MSRIETTGTPKGVDMIADVEMFFGALIFIAGMLMLFSISFMGILMVANGIFLIMLGWALKDLHRWAWWGSILINLVIFIQNVIVWTDIFSIINVVVATIVIVYLLIPRVRSQFFKESQRHSKKPIPAKVTVNSANNISQ